MYFVETKGVGLRIFTVERETAIECNYMGTCDFPMQGDRKLNGRDCKHAHLRVIISEALEGIVQTIF